jgi:hypothetical protein
LGRDIHLFVEYDPEGEPPFSGASIQALADGPFSLPRDYQLFQCLAGAGGSYFLHTVATLTSKKVKDSADEAREALVEIRSSAPLIAARGLPNLHSEAVSEELFLPVREEGDNGPWMHDWTPRAQADEWVARGCSFYFGFDEGKNGCVSDPDAHTISYLLLSEIHESLRHHGINLREMSAEFQAVVAAMEVLETNLGTGRTRIVFWFDN